MHEAGGRPTQFIMQAKAVMVPIVPYKLPDYTD